MRSTSPAGPPPEPEHRKSLLEELLCIDGVTDLNVYRMLSGRFGSLEDIPAPPKPPEIDGQLSLFVVAVPGGGEECDPATGSTGNAS